MKPVRLPVSRPFRFMRARIDQSVMSDGFKTDYRR
jgi:hypothetical protein